MNPERGLKPPRTFQEIESEMKSRGFVYAGLESLTTFKFSDAGRFAATPLQTREELLQRYGGSNREVELIDQEGLPEHQKAVYVFVKDKG